MKDNQISTTAMVVSLMRALHTRLDEVKLINDPWGEKLIPEASFELLRQVVEKQTDFVAASEPGQPDDQLLAGWVHAMPPYASVITRARYTIDAIKKAIAKGIDQCVILGAGLDTFSVCHPELADKMNIFEIDHPATQEFKRERLKACGLSQAKTLHYISADLAAEDLSSVLSVDSLDPSKPTIFSWLGVTMYLTREENISTLRAIASSSAPGSEVIFTYIDQAFFDDQGQADSFREGARAVSELGEEWLSGFDPTTLANDLAELGFTLTEDLTTVQLVDRYECSGKNGFQPTSTSRIAFARVSE
jgi:methyltransferase (TIGR00027 family)